MFWDIAANFYDIFANIYNGKVNKQLVFEVSKLIEPEDIVLECACGTGLISKGVACICDELVATDFSVGMLKKAKKNCENLKNITFQKADIMSLEYDNETFDKVVAGNVIHLLDQPYMALYELMRVCKKGGMVIIPTYVNNENKRKSQILIAVLEKFGVKFKKQFDFASYKEFYEKTDYRDIEYILIEGKISCAISVIKK